MSVLVSVESDDVCDFTDELQSWSVWEEEQDWALCSSLSVFYVSSGDGTQMLLRADRLWQLC